MNLHITTLRISNYQDFSTVASTIPFSSSVLKMLFLKLRKLKIREEKNNSLSHHSKLTTTSFHDFFNGTACSLFVLLLFCHFCILFLSNNFEPVSAKGSSPFAGCVGKALNWNARPWSRLSWQPALWLSPILAWPLKRSIWTWCSLRPSSAIIWCLSTRHSWFLPPQGGLFELTAAGRAQWLSSDQSPLPPNVPSSLLSRTGREKPGGYWAMAPVALWRPVPTISL